MCARRSAPGAELHLIDPFGEQPGALQRGWAATPWATRRVVGRACGRGSGPRVVWHVAYSGDVGRGWTGGPVDLVFVDGDHLEPGVELDWDVWHPHVAPGGHVLFHDARLGQPGGRGLPGPTAVVDRLFRGDDAVAGWEIAAEVDRCVAVRARRTPRRGAARRRSASSRHSYGSTGPPAVAHPAEQNEGESVARPA